MISIHPLRLRVRTNVQVYTLFHSFYLVEYSNQSVKSINRIPANKPQLENIEAGLIGFLSDLEFNCFTKEVFGSFAITNSNGSVFNAFYRGSRERVFVGVSEFFFPSFARQVFQDFANKTTADLYSTLLELCEQPILPTSLMSYSFQVGTVPRVIRFTSIEQPEDFDFSAVALSILTPEMLVAAWESLMIEEKVVVVSNNTTIIQYICELLKRIVLPLSIVTFSPFLPKEALQVIEAPVPYLVGGCSRHILDNMFDLSETVIVDLDRRHVIHGGSRAPVVSTAPPRLIRQLLSSLNQIMLAPLSELIGRTVDNSNSSTENWCSRTIDKVVDTFIATNISLLTSRACGSPEVPTFFRRGTTISSASGQSSPFQPTKHRPYLGFYRQNSSEDNASGTMQLLRERYTNDENGSFVACWIEMDDMTFSVFEYVDDVPMAYFPIKDIRSVSPLAIEPEGHVFEMILTHGKSFRFVATDPEARKGWVDFIEERMNVCKRYIGRSGSLGEGRPGLGAQYSNTGLGASTGGPLSALRSSRSNQHSPSRSQQVVYASNSFHDRDMVSNAVNTTNNNISMSMSFIRTEKDKRDVNDSFAFRDSTVANGNSIRFLAQSIHPDSSVLLPGQTEDIIPIIGYEQCTGDRPVSSNNILSHDEDTMLSHFRFKVSQTQMVKNFYNCVDSSDYEVSFRHLGAEVPLLAYAKDLFQNAVFPSFEQFLPTQTSVSILDFVNEFTSVASYPSESTEGTSAVYTNEAYGHDANNDTDSEDELIKISSRQSSFSEGGAFAKGDSIGLHAGSSSFDSSSSRSMGYSTEHSRKSMGDISGKGVGGDSNMPHMLSMLSPIGEHPDESRISVGSDSRFSAENSTKLPQNPSSSSLEGSSSHIGSDSPKEDNNLAESSANVSGVFMDTNGTDRIVDNVARALEASPSTETNAVDTSNVSTADIIPAASNLRASRRRHTIAVSSELKEFSSSSEDVAESTAAAVVTTDIMASDIDSSTQYIPNASPIPDVIPSPNPEVLSVGRTTSVDKPSKPPKPARVSGTRLSFGLENLALSPVQTSRADADEQAAVATAVAVDSTVTFNSPVNQTNTLRRSPQKRSKSVTEVSSVLRNSRNNRDSNLADVPSTNKESQSAITSSTGSNKRFSMKFSWTKGFYRKTERDVGSDTVKAKSDSNSKMSPETKKATATDAKTLLSMRREEAKKILRRLIQHAAFANRKAEEELQKRLVDARTALLSALVKKQQQQRQHEQLVLQNKTNNFVPDSDRHVVLNTIIGGTADTSGTSTSSAEATTSTPVADSETWHDHMWTVLLQTGTSGRTDNIEDTSNEDVTLSRVRASIIRRLKHQVLHPNTSTTTPDSANSTTKDDPSTDDDCCVSIVQSMVGHCFHSVDLIDKALKYYSHGSFIDTNVIMKLVTKKFLSSYPTAALKDWKKMKSTVPLLSRAGIVFDRQDLLLLSSQNVLDPFLFGSATDSLTNGSSVDSENVSLSENLFSPGLVAATEDSTRPASFDIALFLKWAFSLSDIVGLQAYRLVTELIHHFLCHELATLLEVDVMCLQELDPSFHLGIHKSASASANAFSASLARSAQANMSSFRTQQSSSSNPLSPTSNGNSQTAAGDGILNGHFVYTESVGSLSPCELSVTLVVRVRELLRSSFIKTDRQSKVQVGDSLFTSLNVSADLFLSLLSSSAFSEFELETCKLQAVDLRGLSTNALTMFFCNIYNALIVHGTIVYAARGAPGSTLYERSSFLKNFKYNIGGHLYSALDVEHGVLRAKSAAPGVYGTFSVSPVTFWDRDPRRDFILKQPKPYITFFLFTANPMTTPLSVIRDAESVDEELEIYAKQFIQRTVYFDPDKRQLLIPEILRIYLKDFGDSTEKMITKLLKLHTQELKDRLGSVKWRSSFYAIDWSPVLIF